MVTVLICTVLTSFLAFLRSVGLYREGGSPQAGVILPLLAVALLAAAWWWLLRLKRAPWVARSVAVSALVVMLAAFYEGVGKKAQLAADQGTIAALRSASAIYYGKNGVFPTQPTLQTLVEASRTGMEGRNPFGAALRCPGASWSADTTNGKITYTPNTLDAC